ncbi:hypothetical protein BB934_27690 (plasmid) [Microvirga ossetica]|uniref:Uncharacterized protein n=1 Tax=Microvirga ossetica TaxID=1882682 RepID=A0A1B2EQ83_9HYPH|nr:hypothetical protein BB934_27690 [Microvirga ossetica]
MLHLFVLSGQLSWLTETLMLRPDELDSMQLGPVPCHSSPKPQAKTRGLKLKLGRQVDRDCER